MKWRAIKITLNRTEVTMNQTKLMGEGLNEQLVNGEASCLMVRTDRLGW